MKPGVKGDCFANANKCVQAYPDATVVHGTVRFASGKRGPHAWLETNGDVIDPTAGARLDRQSYYEAVEAKPEARYSQVEALLLMLREKHHGPWHTKPRRSR